MSSLLKQSHVREALALLGITDPCSENLYLSILSACTGAQNFFGNMGNRDSEGFHVSYIDSYCIYMAADNSPRRVDFRIRNIHDVSQVFLSIIFMKYGIIRHDSRIVIDNELSTDLIKISALYVRKQINPL